MINLTKKEILKIIPHRRPFLHIDDVFDLLPGESAKAHKFIATEDPIFVAHFPGNPIYPGVFLIESAAQLSCVLCAYNISMQGQERMEAKAAYLGGIKNFTFKKAVTPPATLVITAKVIGRLGMSVKIAAEIFCGETPAAEGQLYVSVVDGHISGSRRL